MLTPMIEAEVPWAFTFGNHGLLFLNSSFHSPLYEDDLAKGKGGTRHDLMKVHVKTSLVY
jgi:hypothetical protein